MHIYMWGADPSLSMRCSFRRKGVARVGKREKPFGKDWLVGGGSDTKKV